MMAYADYTRTLQAYRDHFGAEPPKDIWPANDVRFSDVDFQRVNRKRNWVLPKPSKWWSGAVAMAVVVFGALFNVQAEGLSADMWILIFVCVLLLIVFLVLFFRKNGKGGRGGGGSSGGSCSSGCSAFMSVFGCSSSSSHSSGCGSSGCSSGSSGCGSSCGGGCGGGD